MTFKKNQSLSIKLKKNLSQHRKNYTGHQIACLFKISQKERIGSVLLKKTYYMCPDRKSVSPLHCTLSGKQTSEFFIRKSRKLKKDLTIPQIFSALSYKVLFILLKRKIKMWFREGQNNNSQLNLDFAHLIPGFESAAQAVLQFPWCQRFLPHQIKSVK